MKKFLSFFLVAILLFLSACNVHTPNDADTTTESTGAESTFTDVSESSTTENASETSTIKNDQLPLPEESAEFSFLSGAGAWRTIITLNRAHLQVGILIRRWAKPVRVIRWAAHTFVIFPEGLRTSKRSMSIPTK